MTTEPTTTEAAPAPDSKPSIGPSNAELLAEMDGLGDDLFGEKKPAAKEGAAEPAEDKPEEEVEADGEKEEEPAEDADEETEEEAEEETEDEEEPTEDEKPDQVAAKRIEAIQKAEKRSKEQIDSYRAEAERTLAAQRAAAERELAPIVEKAERVQAIIDRATIDPLAFADECGWDDDAKLYFAEQLYLEAKGAKDPKYKEQAIRRRREREAGSKTAELEKKYRELEQRIEREAQARREDAYLMKAASAITDTTPIVKAMFAKSPDSARERLRYVASQLGDASPEEVISKLEEVERLELVSRGVDPDKVFGTPKAKTAEKTKTKAQEAGERKTAKTNSKNGTTKTPQVPPEELTTAQLVKELEELERN